MPLVEPGRKAPAFALPDQDGAAKYGAWQKKRLYGWTYMGVARILQAVAAL